MIFKVNEKVLEQVKATVEQCGICYLHASGQFYVDKKRSDDHRIYSDPDIKEAEYVLVFKNIGEVPNIVEEVEKMFFAAKQKEIVESHQLVEAKTMTIINMPKSEKKSQLKSRNLNPVKRGPKPKS